MQKQALFEWTAKIRMVGFMLCQTLMGYLMPNSVIFVLQAITIFDSI